MRCLAVLILLAMGVQAEHRVALLIEQAGSPPLGERIQSGLERHGFRCKRAGNLREKELRRTIETFCEHTPTAGTAMIVFAGRLTQRGLAGTDSKPERGFGWSDTFETMNTRGGSRYNLLWHAASPATSRLPDLPPNAAIGLGLPTFLAELDGQSDLLAAMREHAGAFTSTVPATVRIAGRGSRAVAPPESMRPGKQAGDEWVNPRGMVFCWIPPGRFLQGSPLDEPGRFADEAQRETVIEHGFWMGKYEVTVRENHRRRVPHNAVSKYKNAPLTMVHHDDGKGWDRQPTTEARKSGVIPDDWQYALCTEAQWEYAARAGTTTTWHFGDDPAALPRHANVSDKSHFDTGSVDSNHAAQELDDGHAGLAEVGLFAPNPWGLHDVHGNVSEWCLDRQVKGGSYISPPAHTRPAHRYTRSARDVRHYVGYRVVIQPEPQGR